MSDQDLTTLTESDLLIESSGLYIRLDPTSLNLVREASDKGSEYILRNVPSTIMDKENNNGRIYTQGMFEAELARAQQTGAFANRTLHCVANDHPKTAHVPPTEASHVIVDAKIAKDGQNRSVLLNDWLILNTVNGKNLRALIEDNVAIPTSIRGLGKVNPSSKQVNPYRWLGTDGVGNPSAGTMHTYTKENCHYVVAESYAPSYSAPNLLVPKEYRMDPKVARIISELSESLGLVNGMLAESSRSNNDIVSALTLAEASLVSSGVGQEGMKAFTTFKESLIGASATDFTRSRGNGGSPYRIIGDHANRLLRVTQEGDVTVAHLQRNLNEQEAELKATRESLMTSNKLINDLTAKLSALPGKIKTQMETDYLTQSTALVESTKTKLATQTETTIATVKTESDRALTEARTAATTLTEGILETCTSVTESVITTCVGEVERILEAVTAQMNDVLRESYTQITSLETRYFTLCEMSETLRRVNESALLINQSLVNSLQSTPKVHTYASREVRVAEAAAKGRSQL